MNINQNFLGFAGAGLGFAAALATLAGFGEPGTVDGISINYYHVLMLSAFSAIGLWATIARAKNPRRSGKLLIAAAAGGIITAPLLYFVPAMLLLTVGLKAFKTD